MSYFFCSTKPVEIIASRTLTCSNYRKYPFCAKAWTTIISGLEIYFKLNYSSCTTEPMPKLFLFRIILLLFHMILFSKNSRTILNDTLLYVENMSKIQHFLNKCLKIFQNCRQYGKKESHHFALDVDFYRGYVKKVICLDFPAYGIKSQKWRY